MTKEENIDYLTLRAEECRFPAEMIQAINRALMMLDDDQFTRLKRISEPEFRKWCKEATSLN